MNSVTFPIPPTAVGGSFILSLQRRLMRVRHESHQRSWWIVHTQPTETADARPSRIPPTQLVDCSYPAYAPNGRFRPRMNDPPTALVGLGPPRLPCRLCLKDPSAALVVF